MIKYKLRWGKMSLCLYTVASKFLWDTYVVLPVRGLEMESEIWGSK